MDCEKYKNYDKLTPDNRLDVLKEFAGEWSRDNDMEPPDFNVSELPDDPNTPKDESEFPFSYYPETNEIRVDPDTLSERDSDAVLTGLGHELAHAQVHDWFKDDPGYDFDEWRDASEWYGDLFGDSYADDLKKECDNNPPESPADDDLPDDEGEDDGGGEGDVPRPGWNMPPQEQPENG
jgi:hypothetical protein